MVKISKIECSVMGTVLLYPNMTMKLLRTLYNYRFSTNTRKVFFTVLKRMVEEKQMPKTWEECISFKKCLLMFATDEELDKGECSREELQGELYSDVRYADLVNFKKLLYFLMDYSIYNKMASFYWDILNDISRFEELSVILEKNKEEIDKFKKYYNEKEKRISEY